MSNIKLTININTGKKRGSVIVHTEPPKKKRVIEDISNNNTTLHERDIEMVSENQERFGLSQRGIPVPVENTISGITNAIVLTEGAEALEFSQFYFNEKLYAEAAKSANEGLKVLGLADDMKFKLLIVLARAYFMLGEKLQWSYALDEAIKVFHACGTSDFRNKKCQFYLQLCSDLSAQNNHSKIEEAARAGIEIYHRNFIKGKLYHYLTVSCISQKKYPEAIIAINDGLSLSKDCITCQISKELKGFLPRLIEIEKNILHSQNEKEDEEINPEDEICDFDLNKTAYENTLLLLGLSFEQKRYAEAEKIAREGLNFNDFSDENKTILYSKIAEACLKQNKDGAAEEAAREGLKMPGISENTKFSFYFFLSTACIKQKKDREAEEAAIKALKADSPSIKNKSALCIYLAEIYLRQNRNAAAEAAARKGLMMPETSDIVKAQLYINLSIACIKQRKSSEAQKAAREGLNIPDLSDGIRKKLYNCLQRANSLTADISFNLLKK